MIFHDEEEFTCSMPEELSEEELGNQYLKHALGILESYARFGYNGHNITWDTVTWASDYVAEMLEVQTAPEDFDLRARLDAAEARRRIDSASNIVTYPVFRAPVIPKVAL